MYPKNDISWDLDKYLGSFNFRISINLIAQEKMKVVSINNIVSESDIVEYMLGPEPYTRKIPGRAKFSEVEITRIYQGYDSFYDWRTKIEDGVDDLRTVTVEILAPDLETTVRKMVLHNCWPHRWQLPNLDASSTAPAIETIVLACERVTQSLNSALAPQLASSGADAGAGQGSGPIGGRGFALEADYGEPGDGPVIRGNASGEALWTEWQDAIEGESTIFDPNEETWDPPSPVEDPTAARNGGDGDGPLSGRGEQAEVDTSPTNTGPLDPNEETWDAPEAGDDTQDFRENDDTKFTGDGITDNNKNNDREAQDLSAGDGPIGGRGAAAEADYGSPGSGPIDPNEETWDAPEAVDDPTAARNGGDGSGPIGGRGFALEADYGSPGSGPIDPNEETWDAPEAVDDPTAARNGGDGSGPIGGRGEGGGGHTE